MGRLQAWGRRYGVTVGLAGLLLAGALWLRLGEPPVLPPDTSETLLPPDPARARDGGAAAAWDRVLIDRSTRGGLLGLRRYEIAGRSEWWLDAPHVRADDEGAEALWRALQDGRILRRLVGARSDAQYGLAGDGYRIQARLGGHAVRLGADAADGEVYGARDNEQDVLVLEGRLRDLLQRSREALTRRQLTLQPVDPAQVQRLEVGAVALLRRPSSWQVTQRALPAREAVWFAHEDDAARPLPVGRDRPAARAREGQVALILKVLREAQAARILGGSGIPFRLSDYRIRPAPLVLKLDGVEQLFTGLPCPAGIPREVGAAAQGAPDGGLAAAADAVPLTYAVRADGAQLCFPASTIAQITLDYDALREPRLVPFAAAEIQSLRITPGAEAGPVTVLRRQGGASWLVGDEAAESDAVDAYLGELLALRGGVVPAAGLPSPPLRVTLEVVTRAGDALRLQLRGDRVQRDGEEPLALAPEDAARLRSEALRFARRQLLRFPLYDVRSLRREHLGEVELLQRVSEAGPLSERLRLKAPADAPADPDRLARALGVLSDLRVLRLLGDAEAGPALAAPRSRFTIAVGDRVQRVELGAALPDDEGCAVRVSAAAPGSAVRSGVLPLAACDDLLKPLATRALLLIDDARLIRVALRGPALGAQGPVVLRREGGHTTLRSAAAPERALSDASRDAILAPLRALAHAEVLAYGPAPAVDPLLVIEVAQAPWPSGGAAPSSDVPPPQQILSLYRDPAVRGGLVAHLSGRSIGYQIPAALLPALTRLGAR